MAIRRYFGELLVQAREGEGPVNMLSGVSEANLIVCAGGAAARGRSGFTRPYEIDAKASSEENEDCGGLFWKFPAFVGAAQRSAKTTRSQGQAKNETTYQRAARERGAPNKEPVGMTSRAKASGSAQRPRGPCVSRENERRVQ